MAPPRSHRFAEQIEKARQLYHRLVIVAAPPRSGKTSALRALHDERAWPLVNVNLALSEKLLELTAKQRALRVVRVVDDIVQEQAGDTVLLDNIEMLFHPDLKATFGLPASGATLRALWRLAARIGERGGEAASARVGRRGAVRGGLHGDGERR